MKFIFPHLGHNFWLLFKDDIFNILIYIDLNVKIIKIILGKWREWGLGIGDWGLGIGPNPQSPIPNPQSPIPNPHLNF